MDIYSDNYIKEILGRLRCIINMAESQERMINDKGATNLETITALRMITHVAADIHIMLLAHTYEPRIAELTISGKLTEEIMSVLAEPGEEQGLQSLVDIISERMRQNDNGISIEQRG